MSESSIHLDPAQAAAQEQFSRQSHRYGKSHILADVSDVEAALSEIALPTQADVLDVATGAGHTGLHLASLGHRVILTDISEAMLARASELAAERGLTVETRLHPAEKLPYPDASFDLVCSRVAPHHFSDVEGFVRESARVLRPGGWFLLIDGSIPDGEPEAEEWIHQIEKLRDPSHGRLLAPGAWSALCKQAGLTVRQCVLVPMKQPDLNWYFETAATSEPNRWQVLELIESAPESARRVFRLGREEEKIVWWWPRLTLIAQRS